MQKHVEQIAELSLFFVADVIFSLKIDRNTTRHVGWVEGNDLVAGIDTRMLLAEPKSFLHPDDIAKSRDCLANLLTNNRDTVEVRIGSRTKPQWVKLYARPIWSESENHVVEIQGVLVSITGSREKNIHIGQESLEIYKIWVAGLGHCVVLVDALGRVLSHSQAAEQLFKFSDREFSEILKDAGLIENAQDFFQEQDTIVIVENRHFRLKIQRIESSPLILWGCQIIDITEQMMEQDQLKFLIEQLPVGLFQCDATGEKGWVNNALIRDFRVPKDTVQTMNINMLPDQSLQNAFEMALKRREIGEYLGPYKPIFGERSMHLHLKAAPLAGGGAIGFIADKTDQVQLEAELRRLQQEQQLLNTSQTEFFVRFAVDGTIRVANHAFCKAHYLDPNQIVGLNLFRLIDWEAQWKDELRNLDQFKPIWVCERRTRLADDRTRYFYWRHTAILEDGQIREYQSTGYDITQKKTAQNQTRTLSQQFRNLTTNIAGIVYRMSANGDISFINPYVYELTGHMPRDFIEKRIDFDAMLLSVDQNIRNIQTFLHRKMPFEFRYRIWKADGERRWFHERGQGVYDDTGKLLYVDGVITDITIRKRMEAQIIQTAKAASIRHLMPVHELGNILTAIFNQAQDEATRQLCRQAQDIVSQIIQPTPEVPFTSIQINEIIRELLPLLTYLVPNITITLDLTSTVRIQGTIYFVQQILTNLLLNAQEAMTEDGTLVISTRDRNGNLVLQVTDNGSGMTKKVQEQIFEPFFTTRKDGTGIGLPAVKLLVTQLGGNVTVESTVGQGTTFSICIPGE